jgi:hypothetical protein
MELEAHAMDATTLDRLLTDALLIDVSGGLDKTAEQLGSLHESWTLAGVDAGSVDWLGGLITNLYWWSGRLLGGVSLASEQGVPDRDPRSAISS